MSAKQRTLIVCWDGSVSAVNAVIAAQEANGYDLHEIVDASTRSRAYLVFKLREVTEYVPECICGPGGAPLDSSTPAWERESFSD